MPDNELQHWGIPGQKWGLRKYQYEDGSLTPEGELRYNKGKQKAARGKATEMYKTKKYKQKLALKAQKQKVKDEADLAKTAKKEQAKLNATDRVVKKKAKNMTDEELSNEVNRLTKELEYQMKSWRVKKGQKGPTSLDKMDDFFERPTGRLVADIGKSVATQAATVAVKNFFDKAKGGKDGKGGKEGKDGKGSGSGSGSPINISINNNPYFNNNNNNNNNNQNANVNQNRNTNVNQNANIFGFGGYGSGYGSATGVKGTVWGTKSGSGYSTSSSVKSLPSVSSSVIGLAAPKSTLALPASKETLALPDGKADDLWKEINLDYIIKGK